MRRWTCAATGDPSGLYATAGSSAVGNLPGVSFPYEAPEDADLVLATDQLPVAECVDGMINLLKEQEGFEV